MTARRAVVLLSGGLDSATVLAIARSEGSSAAASWWTTGSVIGWSSSAPGSWRRAQGVQDVRVVSVDLRAIGGSALTADIDVPKDRAETERGAGIPVTYVPARNTLFLALALGLAETLGAIDLFIGVNAVDYSGYPDCRPEFVRAFEALANLATRAGVEGARFRVHAPLSGLRKAEIIQTGARLGVDYALTHSCYDPDPLGRACGRCDSCLIRRDGFRAAGVPDPTPYVT
jgi:7-cyano-7-deazaguanine synthase